MRLRGWDNMRRLASPGIISAGEMRRLILDVICRWLVALAILAAIYTIVFGQPGILQVRILLACGLSGLTALLAILSPQIDYRIRAGALLIALFLAGCLSEVDPHCLFFGRSTVLFSLLIAIAPSVCTPVTALGMWLLIQAATVIYAVSSGAPFPVYTSVILLLVAAIAWLVMSRLDHMVDAMARKIELTQKDLTAVRAAIEIVTTIESDALRKARGEWQQTAAAATVSRD